MRSFALSAVKAGITRLRTKGGASADSLYDLVNGYVTSARTMVMRPASVLHHSLPPGTKGLVVFRGKFVVFASTLIAPGSSQYTVEILRHPDSGFVGTLVDIHFASPFLGYLYVVAEWSDGSVFHYWLQAAQTWAANTVYAQGAVVQPTVPNGYAYVAERIGDPPQPWAAGVLRAVNDKVEPTTPNGFEYTAVETYGDTPASGQVEPTWPTVEGAVVYEDTNGALPPAAGNTTPAPAVPPDVRDRYGTGGNLPPTQVQ